MTDEAAPLIKASGGVVYRLGPDGTVRFAVVHKAKYGTWGLPKGKLTKTEGWVGAALREVTEETGTTAQTIGPVAVSSYFVDGVPKVVVWYLMRAVRDEGFEAGHEIDSVAWLKKDEVVGRLAHPGERRVFEDLASVLPGMS